MRAASWSPLTIACVARDGVFHEREELDHVTVDESDVDRRLGLAADRAQNPVRALRSLTPDTAVRGGLFGCRSVIGTALVVSDAARGDRQEARAAPWRSRYPSRVDPGAIVLPGDRI